MASSCVLMRSRLIARVISGVHDQELRPFGVNASQFSLLLVMYQMGPSTRSGIGRYHHQDRSTLTRNLRIMIGEGWIEEDQDATEGRSRPVRLTAAGIALILRARPAWEAGQREAMRILGDEGTGAVMAVASRILATTRK